MAALSHLLVADQDDGDVGAEVFDLRRPLLGDVLERVRRIDAEAHQDDVGVRVGQRPEAIVVLLTSRVPQRQFNLLKEGKRNIWKENKLRFEWG